MFYLKTHSKAILQALAMLCLTSAAPAQIGSLCNTGQTAATLAGCTGALVTPNPPGGGPARDGNWQLAYPYPSTLTTSHSVCTLTGFVRAWVDTPNASWLPDSVSTASEWITPVDGENNVAVGSYVYRTTFQVPSVLPGGAVPAGVTINGQLASDNATLAIYLESPANSAKCSLVTDQKFPVNPAGHGVGDFEQWWDFSFTNSLQITPGAAAFLYFVVQNQTSGASPTGLRVEFFSSSMFF
jgi:hypothetical protein